MSIIKISNLNFVGYRTTNNYSPLLNKFPLFIFIGKTDSVDSFLKTIQKEIWDINIIIHQFLTLTVPNVNLTTIRGAEI